MNLYSIEFKYFRPRWRHPIQRFRWWRRNGRANSIAMTIPNAEVVIEDVPSGAMTPPIREMHFKAADGREGTISTPLDDPASNPSDDAS